MKIPLRYLRRLTAALLAVCCACTALAMPAAALEGSAGALASLSEEDSTRMQQADEALAALAGGEEWAQLPNSQKADAVAACLASLSEEGLVRAGSAHYDAASGLVSFSYACGVLGGVLLDGMPGADAEADTLPEPVAQSAPAAVQMPETAAQAALSQQNGLTEEALAGQNNVPMAAAVGPSHRGRALICYAFDDGGSTSSRHHHYATMQQTWSAAGLETYFDEDVTVRKMASLEGYDLYVLSAHGFHYTYSYGWLWKRTATAPIMVLRERASWQKDLRYAVDLLTHRVIKVSGYYCLLPAFFEAHYRYGSGLNGAMVFSELCDFLGADNMYDDSFAQALLAAGASTVVGFANAVYTIYSRNMLRDFTARLLDGFTAGEAFAHMKAVYGENDVIWFTAMGGAHPHRYAAYPVLFGAADSRLPNYAGARAVSWAAPAAETPTAGEAAAENPALPAAA